MNHNLDIHPAPYRSRDGRAAEGAQRGTLSVPMNRARPGGPRVELAFVRLPARSARPRAPIVFLTGGPGLSAIRAGAGRLFGWFEALRAHGDVVLLDQRGCGESRPVVDCAGALRLPIDRAMTRDEVRDEVRAAIRRCAEQRTREGIDLAAFNTNESADDVADLVRTLYGVPEAGETRVALLGWSYGSHLAMAVVKRHEALVDRAILAGPEGPDHTDKLPSRIQRHLEMIATRVREDAAWRERMPDLLATLRAVLDRADREPARVPATGAEVADVTVGRFDLEWIISQGLADPRFLRRLPSWLRRMEQGDFSGVARDPLLRGAFDELRTGLGGSLLRTCMDCASGASASRRERIEREAREALLGRTIDFPFPEVCAAIGNPDLGDDFRAAPRSSVPVLFITGTLDCRTPADNVLDLSGGFPHHRHLVVEDAGHGDLLLPTAVQHAIARFLDDGTVQSERVRADERLVFEPGLPVLLFDGSCAFCRSQVAHLRRRAGSAVEFAPFQEAAPRFPHLAVAELARAVHFVDADGSVSRGAEAVFRALAAPRGSHPLLWMYRRLPGFRPVVEWGYRQVARYRSRLGRRFM